MVSWPVSRSHTLMSTPPEKSCLPSPDSARGLIPRWRVSVSLPVSRSHTLIVLSWLPEQRRLPSLDSARLDTSPLCPRRVRSSLPVATSHTLIGVSKNTVPVSVSTPGASPAEKSRLPSFESARLVTPVVCRVMVSLPASTSHTLIVPSELAEKSRLPSLETARLYTRSVWPRRVSVSLPVSRSHTLISPGLSLRSSRLAEKRRLPSQHNTRLVNISVCLPRVPDSLPVSRSHSLIVPSLLAEKRRLSLVANARLTTSDV